jgi:hypothetical protein
MTSENEQDSKKDKMNIAFKQAAEHAWALYQAYQHKGFTPGQSFELTRTTLDLAVRDVLY